MYEPLLIGKKCRIVPPEAGPSEDGRIDLVIAKGAFGSGEHETTASCLEIMEELPDLQGARVLDLGSGTGILAIAALKLGAESALCVDINPQAVETARRNCALNELEDRAEHLLGTLSSVEDRTFDLVLANIYGDLLVDLASELVPRARPGGRLLLSGMLWEYNFEVRALYERLGCSVEINRMLPEFSTVVLKRLRINDFE